MKHRNCLLLLCLLLAFVAGFLSLAPVCAADINPKKPILTRSGKKAALLQAAQSIREISQAALLQKPAAAPVSPTDQTRIPHYYGPFPNWVNTQFTLPDAQVVITGKKGGSGAKAVATVGANGVITGITVTEPGSGYKGVTVGIVGPGTGAKAKAKASISGVVAAINVNSPGSGYTDPKVTITGGSSKKNSAAAATAYGGVDAITIDDPGFGYIAPMVDFDLPSNPDGVKAMAHVDIDGNGSVTAVYIDNPGSGYSSAPNVVIRDGSIFEPIQHDPGTFSAATAASTLSIQSVGMDSFGTGFKSAPGVTITDANGSGSGATATATVTSGSISSIQIKKGGSGYVSTGGIRKFVDGLPGLGEEGMNNLGQYLPIAVADTTTFSTANGFDLDADYYVIALVQHRERMHSNLPPTLLRQYVQLETPANAAVSKHIALRTALLNGTSVPTLMPDGSQAYAVDDPHFLGPLIVAQKDRPVRIVFYNLLPTGSDGDLFIPADSTFMGSGPTPDSPMELFDPVDDGTVLDAVRNPFCSEYPKSADCFKDNRATLHLHGGITPWISDGTPHQWITPANETTPWPEGVSVGNVPDMTSVAGVPDCTESDDGCQTFYYTNQQSARLMFYHDHAWGITRLNVYGGEAAGYMINDPTEQKLVNAGLIPANQIPLVIQDRTFIPDADQLAWQDPTWDTNRWGGKGSLWYEHVYMPAQNPDAPGGLSGFGRWFYGAWFWPPATPKYGPIANPYYNMDPATNFTTTLSVPCNLDDPATWQYQTDPFCEPEFIPGTPNNSAGMEQFNDTPIVNGTAYPTLTVEPKSYRLRILNAANDRFFNLQWYVGDPNTASTGINGAGEPIGPTEVALNPAELAAAQADPNIFPTPDTSVSPAGPDWIQIGNEGGFLPAPAVIPNQPTTWIIDPTRFDVGNVDQHSLLLGSAERADVIVDFSQYEGKTLILYNDAPAAFPARISTYDYYTGAPDLTPVGAPTTLPGYGPNTRTIMQVKVMSLGKKKKNAPPLPAFNLAALQEAFKHKADGSGAFEAGQNPIIVGQAAYNSAYARNFPSASYCNGGSSSTLCDGYARIADQGGTLFGFNTLLAPTSKLKIPIEPKAIHDETNAVAFDDYARMTANIGLEVVPATPAAQNVVLYPYVNPASEIYDATNLPQNNIGVQVTPIASADGTQIWKITHNGVDTHPLHWHLYDVQLLNRVTWDNIIIPPDANELGWKETIRISPLQDTYIAIRPIIPALPFELPNSIRPLHPMMPIGSMMGFSNIDANGNPTNPIVNALTNFGWEYVWHCHILSHEEMDMMRPVSVAVPPYKALGLDFNFGTKTLSWTDNSISETAYIVEKSENGGVDWTPVTQIDSPLAVVNTAGNVLNYTDDEWVDGDMYRVVAENTVGYGGQFMQKTVQSVSATLTATAPTP